MIESVNNGIKHRLTRPYESTTTGMVERLHRIARREFFELHIFDTATGQVSNLVEFSETVLNEAGGRLTEGFSDRSIRKRLPNAHQLAKVSHLHLAAINLSMLRVCLFATWTHITNRWRRCGCACQIEVVPGSAPGVFDLPYFKRLAPNVLAVIT